MVRCARADELSVIQQRLELGAGPWQTADPFLFCVHHLDVYPEGNGAFGPDASLLGGRQIGQDFAVLQQIGPTRRWLEHVSR